MVYYHAPQVDGWGFSLQTSGYNFQNAVVAAHKEMCTEPHRFLLRKALSIMGDVVDHIEQRR